LLFSAHGKKYPPSQFVDITGIFDGHGQTVICHSSKDWPAASHEQLRRRQQTKDLLLTVWALLYPSLKNTVA
jgi:hypothetical protein